MGARGNPALIYGTFGQDGTYLANLLLEKRVRGLGKVNYCINTLIEECWIKPRNIRNSKLTYAYLPTPRGIEQKAAITVHFLPRRMAKYEILKKEIARLGGEV